MLQRLVGAITYLVKDESYWNYKNTVATKRSYLLHTSSGLTPSSSSPLCCSLIPSCSSNYTVFVSEFISGSMNWLIIVVGVTLTW